MPGTRHTAVAENLVRAGVSPSRPDMAMDYGPEESRPENHNMFCPSRDNHTTRSPPSQIHIPAGTAAGGDACDEGSKRDLHRTQQKRRFSVHLQYVTPLVSPLLSVRAIMKLLVFCAHAVFTTNFRNWVALLPQRRADDAAHGGALEPRYARSCGHLALAQAAGARAAL